MNNNVLTYAEYQKRLKELKTPEDIASFAQELIAPAFAGNMTPEKKEAKPDEPKDEAPDEPRKKYAHADRNDVFLDIFSGFHPRDHSNSI